MLKFFAVVALTATSFAAASSVAAQDAEPAVPVTEPADESLKIYFDSGSARVQGDQQATLDEAARLFRDGSPIVMIVAGGADTVGDPDSNLDLSVRRAQVVLDGLVARGIPAERLQLLARGNSELAVETPAGVERRENRRVEISWR